MTDTKQIEIPVPVRTRRIVIREPRHGDEQAVFDAVQESMDVLRPWLHWPPKQKSVADIEDATRNALEAWAERSALHMRTWDAETGDFIGGAGFIRTNWDVPVLEIGYWLRTSRQGSGLMSEAVNALTRWGFDALGAKRIEIQADTANERSRAVAERLGFVLEGVMRNEDVSPQGHVRDTALYARIDADGLPGLDVDWPGRGGGGP